MRRPSLALNVVAALVLVAGMASLANAQAAPSPKVQASPQVRVAVVDFVAIRRNAAAARSITEQVEAFVADYQTDIETEEAQLRQAQEELTKKHAIVGPEAYETERGRWEHAVADAQRRFLVRRQTMDGARAEAWERVNRALAQVIKDVAAEQGFDLILRRDQAVFVVPHLDITDEVLARLDQVLPVVDVSVPGG
jgi:Skp family chaperone for outer membrane proteins